MRIQNTTTGIIIIADLPNVQGGSGLNVPPGIAILIFNEDAERSTQLGSFLTSGAIVNLGPEEPSSGSPEAQTQPSVIGGSQVSVTNNPLAGQVIIATSPTTAHWASTSATIAFIDGEVPAGVVDGVNTVFTLANVPAANSLHLYMNGLRQRPTIDYTIANQTITFTVAPQAVPQVASLICDYRL